ncbi:MAG TPA: hypothetical protein VGH43_03465 [Jatrophihabitans sp.]
MLIARLLADTDTPERVTTICNDSAAPPQRAQFADHAAAALSAMMTFPRSA